MKREPEEPLPWRGWLDTQCEPPLTRVPRGRPAKKRMNKDEMRRKLGGLKIRGFPDIPDRAPPRCSTRKGLGRYGMYMPQGTCSAVLGVLLNFPSKGELLRDANL